MLRHEVQYDPAVPLIPVMRRLEENGAQIYYINKDRCVIGARIPKDKIEEIRNTSGLTLTLDPIS